VYNRGGQSRRTELTEEVVFVGMTRPAMALGVPYVALLANAFVSLELFLATRNLLWLLVAVPLHGLTFLVCVVEPRFFDLLQVWGIARRRAGFASGGRWGAVSYGPLPGPVRRTFRFDLPIGSREVSW
jgi:type IV secretion system protein VirB3